MSLSVCGVVRKTVGTTSRLQSEAGATYACARKCNTLEATSQAPGFPNATVSISGANVRVHMEPFFVYKYFLLSETRHFFFLHSLI